MSDTVLIGFALLMGVIAQRHPGTVAGAVLGAHGYISSVGYLTGLPWSAAGVAGTLSGLMVLVLDRWRKSSKNLLNYRQLITPIAFLGFVFSVGAVQEYLRGYGISQSVGAADGIAALPELLMNRRDEQNATLIVVTRWMPYTFVAVIGCVLGRPERFLNGFSLSVVLQAAVVPFAFYVEYFRHLAATGVPAGLEWVAINRAYLGYECCVAASWFLMLALGRDRLREAWRLYFFSFLALVLVVLSFSKGPWMALVLSATAIFAAKFRYGSTRVGNSIAIAFPLLVLAGVSAFLLQRYGADNQFVSRIESSFRMSQSLSIRWGLLSRAPFPSTNDSLSWLFGGGFGWSRWQVGADDGSPVFVGSGTHVFFLDVLLDVGAIGLLFIAMSISKIYFIAHQGFSSSDAQARLILNFVPVFCVTLLAKMLLASDSYSEPLAAVLIGLLISLAMQYLAQHGARGQLNKTGAPTFLRN